MQVARPVYLSNTSFFAMRMKRITDVFLSAIGLVLLSPVFGVIATLVRLSSPGAIIFRQKRIGRGGELFEMLKFRSLEMTATNVPFREMILFAHIPYIRLGHWRFGLWLRKSSLDELPQLINVLRGEMSLVGLRPAMSAETDIFAERERLGLVNFPVGITGLYQIGGRKGLTTEERLALERQHGENWSYWLDWWILLLTIPAVLSQRGAEG